MFGDGVSTRASRPAHYWLLMGRDASCAGVFTVEDAHGEEALPVFSFEEEAELFLAGLVAWGESWRVRRTAAGALV